MLFHILTLALGVYARKRDSSCIKWKPCTDAAGVECGSFQVPLDYAHPNVGKATLALARIKAFKQPHLGTIFTNPGGPGGSGTAFIKEGPGEVISNFTNGQYDIVSWDPRGVNQTMLTITPLATCGLTSEDDAEQLLNGTFLASGVEARGNFTDQDDIDNFYAQLNVTDSKLTQIGELCKSTQGETLKYMGTAATARDMVSLSDCLEGPGKLINYWGFSYGTVIGNYFVNMFPTRVGRVIIDGVVDSITWATEPSFKTFASEYASIESTLTGFTQTCAEAGPQRCALAQNTSTPASIGQGIRGLIDTVYELHKAGLSPDLGSADVRDTLRSAMYDPKDWGELASQLDLLGQTVTEAPGGNISDRAETFSRVRSRVVLKTRQNPNASVAIIAELVAERVIACTDSIDQSDVTTKQVFDALVTVTHNESPTFGEALPTSANFYCHRFPIRAVERFTGPFNHHLSHPILVIGNQADPVTPFANAKKIADTLGNSARLLKQNGFGHTSMAEDSDCTRGVIHDYFLHGTLPEDGTVCQVNQVLFPLNSTLAG